MALIRKGAKGSKGVPSAPAWSLAARKHEREGELVRALECYEKAGEFEEAAEIASTLERDDVAARLYRRAGDPLRAAHLLRKVGRDGEAAEAFLEAGYHLDAASSYVDAGELLTAAEIYERERRHDKAADLYLDTGDAGRAADLFLKVGKFQKAAAAFEKKGDFVRAAEAYHQSGRLEEASRAFGQAGEPLRAAKILERRAADLTRERYLPNVQREELERIAATAARFFVEGQSPERAVTILERAELFSEAAAIAVESSEIGRAAELFRRAGDNEQAASMFARAGDDVTAAKLEAEHHLKTGEDAKAAQCLVRAGELLQAAEIYETLGELAEAASLFERCGLADKAARHYGAAGNVEKAAPLLAASGRYLEAAKAAAEANREREMIQYLQRVPPSDASFDEAVVALARAFTRRGWSTLAVDKVGPLLEGRAVDPSNLELFDVLAEALETSGELEKADRIYRQMIAVAFDYRDIDLRHARLLERLAEERTREETLSRTLIEDPAASVSVEGERYTLKEVLGRGGMGEVYHAYDRLLDRSVAYKVVSQRWSEDAGARSLLLREARAAAGLNHPNIITIFDLGSLDERAFIVMELVEGRSYQQLLKQSRRLPLDALVHFLVSVCQGLEHAHRRGVVHRDLKPSNILLTNDHRVKILDFGLSQPMGGGETAASYGGTPKYMPPEQAQARPTDARSDVYSLGASLFELATGRAPFVDGDVIQKHIHEPPPRLRQLAPELPEALEGLVAHCLEKDPARRFQSAGEVLSFARASGLL